LSSGQAAAATDSTERSKNSATASFYHRRPILLVAILMVAALLRVVHLDQSSLWYDEVVTMRLARTASPAALVQLLNQIDATRAPVHPILLQGWVAFFGPSDTSGRAFSVLCGTTTVALVYWIGLEAFGMTTALWASWLCALSPLLVYYSREVRMYMWLVMVTCLAWGLLFSHAHMPRFWKLVVYGFSLVAIAYSHPLGLLMIGALGLSSFLYRHVFQISGRAWFSIYLAVILAIAPWIGRYLDHPPESTTGVLPIRYLLGMPIGFIGGNFTTLLICLLLIAYGLFELRVQERGRMRIILTCPAVSVSLLIWVLVPSLLLYVYSRVVHPIFGPARYTLFVGPAYLVLVARGLGKLPWFLAIAAMAVAAVLSGVMLQSDVYRPDLKADWKDLAAYLNRQDPSAMVAIIAANPSGNTELETARYYLEPDRVVVAWSDRLIELTASQKPLWASIGLQGGQPVCELPAVLTSKKLILEFVDFSRLRLIRVNSRQATTPGT
jgi:mannosyltransferase